MKTTKSPVIIFYPRAIKPFFPQPFHKLLQDITSPFSFLFFGSRRDFYPVISTSITYFTSSLICSDTLHIIIIISQRRRSHA